MVPVVGDYKFRIHNTFLEIVHAAPESESEYSEYSVTSRRRSLSEPEDIGSTKSFTLLEDGNYGNFSPRSNETPDHGADTVISTDVESTITILTQSTVDQVTANGGEATSDSNLFSDSAGVHSDVAMSTTTTSTHPPPMLGQKKKRQRKALRKHGKNGHRQPHVVVPPAGHMERTGVFNSEEFTTMSSHEVPVRNTFIHFRGKSCTYHEFPVRNTFIHFPDGEEINKSFRRSLSDPGRRCAMNADDDMVSGNFSPRPNSPPIHPAEPKIQTTKMDKVQEEMMQDIQESIQTTHVGIERDVIDELVACEPCSGYSDSEMVPSLRASEGSVGHPYSCHRPCLYYRKGECTSGKNCRFCHCVHAQREPRFDKRHRQELRQMPLLQLAQIAVPIIVWKVKMAGIDLSQHNLQVDTSAPQTKHGMSRSHEVYHSKIKPVFESMSAVKLLTIVKKKVTEVKSKVTEGKCLCRRSQRGPSSQCWECHQAEHISLILEILQSCLGSQKAQVHRRSRAYSV